MGFEPNVGALKKHSPNQLDERDISSKVLSILGLEPKTICLKGNCSTY